MAADQRAPANTTRRAAWSAVPAGIRQGVLVAILLVAVLVLVWWVCLAAGGLGTPLPHLFYLPVIVAAFRFSYAGALASGLLAALLAGPALPADVSSGEPQPLWMWALRGALIFAVGLVTAFLAHRDPRPIGSLLRDARMTSALRDALRRRRIEVHYQPILDLGGGGIVGVEALARWRRPGFGDVSPAVFIPVAERSGLIVALDRYVLDRAVRDVQSWPGTGEDFTVSVNVSATRFAEPQLLVDVDEVLDDSGLEPHRLQLEITETGIIPDIAASARQIEALRKRGVRVAIDDFGAGQTSLSYFNQFTVDTVKIDRAFVSQSVAHPQTARVLGGLIDLFDSLGVHVVAEGISSAEEYLELLSLHCATGQGFYLGRPMPGSDLCGLLASQLESRRQALPHRSTQTA